MPSTYAHYIFGQQIRGRLSGYERKVIDKYPELFNIGLHGPDILFYYRPLGKNKVNQLGSRMHSESGAKFFVHAAKVLHTHDQYEKHLAYVYGVLCHFALDVTCHGYVEQTVKETGLAHIAVEGELDRKLMIMNGENPVSRRLTGHIVPSMKNAVIIKDFYRGITAKEVKKALNGIVFYDRILVCPSKIKRMALYAALKVAGLYYDFHGFIIKYHENGFCREQIRRLLHLYEKAVPLADKLICEYKPFLEGSATLDSVYAYTFGSQLPGKEDTLNENKTDKTGEKLDTL